MNLEAFAAEVLRANQVQKTSSKTVKDMMPDPQKTRSYQDVPKTSKTKVNLNITLDRYYFGEDRGEWTMQYVVRWPFAMSNDIKKDIKKYHMEEFAKKWIQDRTYTDDLRYIKVKEADKRKITYVFDAEKWMNDSVRSVRPRFVPPMTLKFKFRKDVPAYIRIDSPPSDLKIFLARKFKEWLRKNDRKLKHPEFKFLQKVTADLFTFGIDLQHTEFTATLKYSVILMGLAAYMMHKHDKNMDKSEVKSIKNKVKNFGDVKRLDRYLKRI